MPLLPQPFVLLLLLAVRSRNGGPRQCFTMAQLALWSPCRLLRALYGVGILACWILRLLVCLGICVPVGRCISSGRSMARVVFLGTRAALRFWLDSSFWFSGQLLAPLDHENPTPQSLACGVASGVPWYGMTIVPSEGSSHLVCGVAFSKVIKHMCLRWGVCCGVALKTLLAPP